MADVFISHSSADHEVAEILCSKLEAQGISCWMAPRDIGPGAIWAEAINDAITKSRVFLVIYSKNSARSTQVPREIGLAGARKLFIIPYKIDNTKLEGEFEYYLLNAHWVTADIAKNDYKINELCSAICQATGKKNTNNPSGNTYINTVNITEVKDNKVVYAPINFKKYRVPLVAAAVLLVLLFIIISAIRSGDKSKPKQQNDTSINAVISESEKNSLPTDAAASVDPEIMAVPADLVPYEYVGVDLLNNDVEKSVTVAGVEYNTAVVLNAGHSENQLMFNVGGEYKKMCFSAGRVDGNIGDVTVRIWLDGEEANPIKISKSELPKAYEYDISGIKHIKIAADHGFGAPQVAFTDFVLSKNADDEVTSSASLAFDSTMDKLNIPADLVPYEYVGVDLLDNDFEKSVTVAGVEYNTAVVLNAGHSENQLMFNIGGEYKKMRFSAGRVDGNIGDVTVRIWLDGEEATPIKISKSELPKAYEYDITGVNHIKIAADHGFGAPQVAFTDFVLCKNADEEVSSSASLAFDATMDKLNIPADLVPYEHMGVELLDNDFEKSVTVAGAEYNTAVVLIDGYGEKMLMFNVGGEYQKMRFTAGRVDGTGGEETVTIKLFLDGEEATPVKLSSTELPKEYEYDITGVKHIRIYADFGFGSPKVAFTDFYLTK